MRHFKKIVAVLSVLLLAAELVVPVDAAAITAKKEEELSREFLKIVRKRYRMIDDSGIAGYVDRVGQRIVAALPPQPFAYHFYVVDEDVYNAFAGPAGHVFIHRGLLEAMQGEEDLAGILGHEIMHVHCRHISDMIDRTQKISILSLAGIIAGMLLGAGGAAELAGAVTVGSAAAGQTMALAYSRENEMQADQLSLKYLAEAGYSGRGLLKMLKEIRSRQWFDSSQVPTYLMTHPAVEDRIAYIGSRLADRKDVKTSSAAGRSDGFAKVHTRLIGLYGDRDAALGRYAAEVEAHPENMLGHYGLGLALERAGQRGEAARHIRLVLQKDAGDPYILRDLGRVYFFDGCYREALAALKGAAGFLPYDVEVETLIGRSQLELGRFREAESTLRDVVARKPEHAQALYYLGESCSRQGRPGEAHYYLGRYCEAEGQLQNAVFHLERALRLLKEPDIRQAAEEKLKALRREKREKPNAAGTRPRFSLKAHQLRSKCENCIVNVPRPWVAERSAVE